MPIDTRAQFLEALQAVSDDLYQAFNAAIQDMRETAQVSAIDEAIRLAMETGNVEAGVRGVLDALQTGTQLWLPLDLEISQAFIAGAQYQQQAIPRDVQRGGGGVGPFIVRFDGRHPRAEAWSRERSAALVTEISPDTEVVIRETIAQAVETNRPYTKTRLDLIGRTEDGARKGGLIGLHSSQARAVRNARAQLEALDPAYFTRERRDRRFDKTVQMAIDTGEPLTQAQIDQITGRYSDRLLQLRGETISRTEGNKAMNAGRAEQIVQMIEDRKIMPEHVSMVWDATPGPRTRDSHRLMNGTRINWGEYFISPVTGAALRWPHDEDGPAEETVNCRCSARFVIDWKAVMMWRRSEALAA